MFLPHQSDNGLQPHEYYPAAAGNYEIGQALNISDGKLTAVSAASTTTPEYLSMARATVVDGEVLPVLRVSKTMVFETTLSAAAADAKIGSKLQVSADGLQVDAGAAGSFELLQIEGTDAGSVVRGRFH